MRRSFVALAFAAAACTPHQGPLEELRWDTPLSEASLGYDPGSAVTGRSLAEIVSGAVDARGEGRTCTACHFTGSVTFYRPEVPQDGLLELSPRDVIDGRAWAGNFGWGAIFEVMDEGSFAEKPIELRTAFTMWAEQEQARVQPLHWDEPVSEANLGVPPDANVAGDLLGEVVNSRVTARPDGLMCSDCHFRDTDIAYRPEIDRGDRTTNYGPATLIDGKSWGAPGGWGDRFVTLGPEAEIHKPDYLRATFFKWKDDGGY
jgi:hypothetical protein